jgi:hypothetical protein
MMPNQITYNDYTIRLLGCYKIDGCKLLERGAPRAIPSDFLPGHYA